MRIPIAVGHVVRWKPCVNLESVKWLWRQRNGKQSGASQGM